MTINDVELLTYGRTDGRMLLETLSLSMQLVEREFGRREEGGGRREEGGGIHLSSAF